MARRRALLPPTDPWRTRAARLALFVQLGVAAAASVAAVLKPHIGTVAMLGLAVGALRDLRLR